jgi:ribosomal protein S5
MKIYSHKINPEHRNSNINQQAGFSAEVKTAAREAAERIIRGGKSKVIRTDDMRKQTDGKGGIIGGTNDQLYDIAEVDANGNYIEGSGRQLKYIGKTPKDCADGLLNKSMDKYREADVPIEVPSDYFDTVKKELEIKADDVKKKIAAAEAKGNTELVNKRKAELERIEKTSKNLKKGKLTKDQAIEARLHPTWSTAKDIIEVGHRGGVEAAKSGVAIGGGIALIRNSVAVIKGDKEPTDAAIDIVCDTATAGALSYATGFTGAAIKGSMQNASSTYVRVLSKTNLPATVATTVFEVGKTLKRYAQGDIDGTDCLIELGEKGTGMLAGGMGAAIGQIVIPVPIVGGFIGGMVGYAMSSAYYNNLVTALKEAKLAKEERLIIEAECREAIAEIKRYRLEMELVINNYLQEHTRVFSEAFADMEAAYNTGDVDGFIGGANRITEKLGGEPLFRNKREFDEIMANPAIIKL